MKVVCIEPQTYEGSGAALTKGKIYDVIGFDHTDSIMPFRVTDDNGNNMWLCSTEVEPVLNPDGSY